jgi:hypothetical protein
MLGGFVESGASFRSIFAIGMTMMTHQGYESA